MCIYTIKLNHPVCLDGRVTATRRSSRHCGRSVVGRGMAEGGGAVAAAAHDAHRPMEQTNQVNELTIESE